MKTLKVLLVVVACAVVGSAATSAKENVTVRVSPNVAIAPATVRVMVTVEPDADNRELELVADSGLFYTSSTVQLDGVKAPRTQWFVLKELPAGTYEVEARVLQKDGGHQRATAEYQILD